MLTVATVLRSGGIYDASWVVKLQAGVAAHLRVAHRFACLSDVDVPCERIALQYDWPGWWAKIELFRLPGPVLFFDLDTCVVGDLADIAGHAVSAKFTMLRDFYAADHFGSGLMAWGSAAPLHLYEKFAAEPEAMMQARRKRMGDQAFIEETHGFANIERWQDFVGDQVVSYKVHCRRGVPAGARVVCLHGQPKFADMPPGDPVRQVWERAA